jgi:FtsH-binding integral membrane protein
MNADVRRIPVASLDQGARADFITRTYLHLLGAIAAFTLIEFMLFATGLAIPIAQVMLSVPWLLILGAFVLVSWIASRFAHHSESIPAQYAALGAYVLAESIIFVPLLLFAQIAAPGSIYTAALVTLMGFTGLTLVAFITRKDFSFLSGVLCWGGMLALLAIAAGLIFGFQLGTFFCVAMVGFAGAAILYDTSNVIHHFPEDRHVGAALELFASVALMFWYVVQLFASRDE